MGVTTVTCYRLDCDTCGKPVEGEGFEGERMAPHWETAAEAIAHLWGDPDADRDDEDNKPYPLLEGQQHADGRIECHDCITKQRCTELGHRWCEWRDCACPDDVTGVCGIRRHADAGVCPQWRACTRGGCRAIDERPAPVAA